MTSQKDFDRWMAQAEIRALQAENARLRQYAQSGAATFEDLYVRDQEIARLRGAIGLATTAAPTMEMDAADPVGMMQRVVAETDTLREQADALADALEELQATVRATCEGGQVDIPGLEILGEALDEAAPHSAPTGRPAMDSDVTTVQRARGWRECEHHDGCGVWQFGVIERRGLPDPLADTPEGWWEFGQILRWAHEKGWRLNLIHGYNGTYMGRIWPEGGVFIDGDVHPDIRAATIAALAAAVRRESENNQ